MGSGGHERDTFPEINPIFNARVQHYEGLAERVFGEHSNSFKLLTRHVPEMVELGDSKLETYQATGYNIIFLPEDMDLQSDKPLIFYNNYIRRTHHFGRLLAEMEQRGIIAENQIRFGVKASRALLGDWKPDERDEQIDEIVRKKLSGETSKQKVSSTVETVITFMPTNNDQAAAIIDYLERNAINLEESWDVPDVRVTIGLQDLLSKTNYVPVVANTFVPKLHPERRVVVGRQSTKFGQWWKPVSIQINKALANFLVGFEVDP